MAESLSLLVRRNADRSRFLSGSSITRFPLRRSLLVGKRSIGSVGCGTSFPYGIDETRAGNSFMLECLCEKNRGLYRNKLK
jgi:hypothetical protein